MEELSLLEDEDGVDPPGKVKDRASFCKKMGKKNHVMLMKILNTPKIMFIEESELSSTVYRKYKKMT